MRKFNLLPESKLPPPAPGPRAPASATVAAAPVLPPTLSPAPGSASTPETACPYVRTIPTETVPTAGIKSPALPASNEAADTALAAVFLVGLNHHTAEVELRERFFTQQLELLLVELRALGLEEVVVLFTCNRIEVYGVSETVSPDAVIEHFATRTGMQAHEITPHLYTARGSDAALHLMRVAAGLESLVLGEAQILGQVADALALATKSGACGPILGRLFGAAVQAGKRARTETDIGRHTLSVSHAGVMLAKSDIPDLSTAKCLVIGAGEMAKLAIAALRSHGANCGADIAIINRTPDRAAELAAETGVSTVAWSTLGAAIETADLILAATSAPAPILHPSLLPPLSAKKRVYIDLGLPRNIDASLAALPHTTLHDLDDLQQVVEQHRIRRQAEAGKVEAILTEELASSLEEIRSLKLVPVITSLRKKIEATVAAELERTIRRLPDMDEETRAEIELLAHRITTKLLHSPTVALRSPTGPQIAPAVCQLFALPQ